MYEKKLRENAVQLFVYLGNCFTIFRYPTATVKMQQEFDKVSRENSLLGRFTGCAEGGRSGSEAKPNSKRAEAPISSSAVIRRPSI